jgi:CDP-diacylglycerol--glycerol-3-phosphate 3-phosphatidyltransferase
VSDQSLVSAETRDRVRGWAVPVATAMGRLGLTPNALTVIGFLGTCLGAIAAGGEQWALAGILVLAFGIFDLFDGALARATGQASRFGAFLDSTLDRTGESIVYVGIAYGLFAAGLGEAVILAGLALTGATIVTYTRARAEALGIKADVGIAPRPERLIIISAGLMLGGALGGVGYEDLAPGMVRIDGGPDFGTWVLLGAMTLILILSAITVVQRIVHVKRQLEQQENS